MHGGAAWPASRAACSPPRPLPSGGPRAAELVFVSRQFVASRFVSRWAKSCGLCSAARHAVTGSATLGPAPFRLRNPVNAKHVGEDENEGARRHLLGQRERGRQVAGFTRRTGRRRRKSRDEEERTRGDTTAVKSHIPKTPSARFSRGRRRREHRHAAWRAGEPGDSLLSDSEIEGVEKGNLWPHSLCTISSTVSRGGEKEL